MRQNVDKEREKSERAWIEILSKRNNTLPGKKEKLWKIYRKDRAQFIRKHIAKIDNRKTKMNKTQFNLYCFECLCCMVGE